MSLLRFDHVNIRTRRLEVLTHFYVSVLGLRVGPRPPFPFGGAWLYLGEIPVVHLVETSEPRVNEDAPSDGSRRREEGLEHFAFLGHERNSFRAILDAHGVAFLERRLPEFGKIQLVFRDPDGNRLHVDFPPDE